jgi:hypothetical protein
MTKLLGSYGYEKLQEARQELASSTAQFLTNAQIDALRQPVAMGLIGGGLTMPPQYADRVAKDLIDGKKSILDKIVALQPIREKELDDLGIYPSSITQYGYERQERAIYRHVPQDRLNSQSVTPEAARTDLGLAHPLDETVRTPTGLAQVGSLMTGDQVTDPATGEAQNITGIFPQGVVPIVRIHLPAGRTARASADHLWLAKNDEQAEAKLVSTADLRKGMLLPVV